PECDARGDDDDGDLLAVFHDTSRSFGMRLISTADGDRNARCPRSRHRSCGPDAIVAPGTKIPATMTGIVKCK
ncbi:MAG: hypothetical protein MUP67_14885, partial [Acidimicrobiia bacterium]|nr:hypothetical protein [Acidimicrobiia bacterium]